MHSNLSIVSQLLLVSKDGARQSASFLYTVRKYKFPAGRPFDVVRNARNKVISTTASLSLLIDEYRLKMHRVL